MKLIDPESLAQTLDNVTSALFFGEAIEPDEAQQVIDWLVSRVGLPGSYRGMAAPTPLDFCRPFLTFSGDPIEGRAPVAHVLGEEALRALAILGPEDACAQEALVKGFSQVASEHPEKTGWYCCGKCSVSMWRHWLARPGYESGLNAALDRLQERRRPNGWLRLPFFYTVLFLSEAPLDRAADELREVGPLMERLLKVRRLPPYAERRQELLRRALARI